jgi:16S rRNA (uracil1498-N3)-methyltransferase
VRIPRIHTQQLLQPHSTIELETGPSQHLARALRMQAGNELVLFDGRGGEYPALIASLDKKNVSAVTAEHRDTDVESPLSIHLGIAVSRGERMDWVVQKTTELGVSAITPLLTERTDVKLSGERAEKKIRHWQQVAISACEQCGRNRVPRIATLQQLSHWLEQTEADRKLVLHHRADDLSGHGNTQPKSLALLIGSEGGLSDFEISLAEQASFQSLRLGSRVLRTETAPLAAIAILQARWGDMGLC